MTGTVYRAKVRLPEHDVWYQIGIGVAGPKGILVTLYTLPTQPGPIQFQLFPSDEERQ